MNKNYVFICGFPRSGTSALVKLLNAGSAFIQSELFASDVTKKHLRIVPEMFEYVHLEAALDKLGRNFDKAKLREAILNNYVLGDKGPLYYRHLDQLNESFPAARFLFVYRNFPDVVASYTKRLLNGSDKWNISPDTAIEQWNEAALEVIRFKSCLGTRLVIVRYEDLFVKDWGEFSCYAKQLLATLSISVDYNSDQRLKKLHSRMLTFPPSHIAEGWVQDSSPARQAIYSELSSISLKFYKLSIIICTYNRIDHLRSCLQAIADQIEEIEANRVEVIVVDNNSDDGTAEFVKQSAANFYWLSSVLEREQGLSNARNCGAKKARARYICYLDDDSRPSFEYLKNILRVIDEHQPDIFGGPVLPFYTTKKPYWFQDALEIRQHTDMSGFSDCLISGGNFIIRAELLRKLGMFSSDYGMVGAKLRLGEERELLERYRHVTPKIEQRVYYSLECLIYHHVPAWKMTIRYFVRRAFESGKMRATLENAINPAKRVRRHEETRQTSFHLWQSVMFGARGIHFPIRFLHRLALICGMFFQRMRIMLSTTPKNGNT